MYSVTIDATDDKIVIDNNRQEILWLDSSKSKWHNYYQHPLTPQEMIDIGTFLKEREGKESHKRRVQSYIDAPIGTKATTKTGAFFLKIQTDKWYFYTSNAPTAPLGTGTDERAYEYSDALTASYDAYTLEPRS